MGVTWNRMVERAEEVGDCELTPNPDSEVADWSLPGCEIQDLIRDLWRLPALVPPSLGQRQ